MVYISTKEIKQLNFYGLNKFLIEEIIYPNELKNNPTKERRIYVSFDISQKGIQNIKVIKGLYKYLDSNCLKILRQYAKINIWHGLDKNDYAKIILPIEFKEIETKYSDSQIDSNYLKFEENLIEFYWKKPNVHVYD